MSGLKMTGWGVTEFVWEGSEECFGKVRREGGGVGTLQASLSSTSLQTLPDLVTPLKGHSFISAQLSTDAVSALRKFGY